MLAPSIQTAPDRSRADALNFFLCSVRDKAELFASFSRAIFVKIRPGYNYSSGCVYIRKKTRQNTMTYSKENKSKSVQSVQSVDLCFTTTVSDIFK